MPEPKNMIDDTLLLDEALVADVREHHRALAVSGDLLTAEQADRAYRVFRERFGPEILANLDGEGLLNTMHARGKDALVYWLEFKADDELPGRFGSIGGGSALKFGFYQSAESGLWMEGPAQKQVPMSIEQAIVRARAQRDQLLAGVRVIESFAARPLSSRDYGELQTEMVRVAPDLAESSWGHKYFAMTCPSVIEPVHGDDYQRHQILKMLKVPGDGRYLNARFFDAAARQLGISLLELCSALHRRNGSPHKYWRVGTTNGAASEWPRMLAGNFVAVGWDWVGDLSQIEYDSAGKERIRELIAARHHGPANLLTREANQLFHFVARAQERDIVLAMEGGRVRGIGRITGAYFHQPGDGPFPHRRPVDWLRVDEEWPQPDAEGLRTTFVPIKKTANILETERRILRPGPMPVTPSPNGGSAKPSTPPPQRVLPALKGLLARVQNVLQRKRQVILFGPPGTGKTFWAERAANELAARSWFATESSQLDDEQRQALLEGRAVELCSFHPAYGYEDFLEGFRPAPKDGAVHFELRDGIFKRLCARAARRPDRQFFLIIDEINRGDIPRIFGELLTVLEKEKRGRGILLPLSGTTLSVPDNVYVIGTMNTADRSIALLDAALRRRFGFVELMPDSKTLADVAIKGLPLGPWLDELNRRVVENAGRDARHLQVGHSYLLPGGQAVRDVARFIEILRDDVVPLLEEYCYGDYEALERILGPALVQKKRQRIESAFFEPERHDDLLEELRKAFSVIATTTDAVRAGEGEAVDEDEEDESGEVVADDESTTRAAVEAPGE